MKLEALRELALQRQSTRIAGYACIGDFHDGLYECNHISPWTKSGCNTDSAIMIIGQDWSSCDHLNQNPPDHSTVHFGFNPDLPTNRNLNQLLERHLGVTRAECYLTNLFPFIKSGTASANIKMSDMVECARRFTVNEIVIVSPRIAVCLGLQTFNAMMRAAGLKGSPKMDEAVDSPFKIANTMVYCVAHPGVLGTNNRNRVAGTVERDWDRLAQSMQR
jgi:restriction system protein